MPARVALRFAKVMNCPVHCILSFRTVRDLSSQLQHCLVSEDSFEEIFITVVGFAPRMDFLLATRSHPRGSETTRARRLGEI